MSRLALTVTIVAAVSAVIGLALYVSFAPCQTLIPSFDSASVEAAEAKELSIRLREYWQSGEQSSALLPRLPRVVKVESIKGKWASLVLAGPMPDGELEGDYGAMWQAIYVRHHPTQPLTCVFLHYAWATGRVNTDCCMAHGP